MLAVSAPLLNSPMRSLVCVLWTRTRVPWRDKSNIIASSIPLFPPPSLSLFSLHPSPLPYTTSLASFPGPAQLSVAYCKRRKAGRGLGTRLPPHLCGACSNPGALLIDGYAAHLMLVDMTDHFCGSHLGSLCSQQVLGGKEEEGMRGGRG